MGSERFHKIRSLEVYGGGFLDGLRLEFCPDLNCIIGARGTGKTTVLEFLRYALKAMPDRERAGGHRKQVEKLIAGNLETGRIRVEIETKDGLVYFVERSTGEEPRVLDADKEPTSLSLDHGSIFSIDVYSQNEIENIANTAVSQLDLLDKFVEEDMKRLRQRQRALLRDLEANASEVVRLTGEVEELTEEIRELPAIEEKLKGLEAEGEEGDAFNREVVLKGLRDRERRTFEVLRAAMTEDGQGLERLARALKTAGPLVPAEVLEGPRAELFGQVAAHLAEARHAIEAGVRSALDAIERCGEELQPLADDLAGQHAEEDERYRELIAQHEREKGRAAERTHLQQRRNELRDKQRTLAADRQALEERRAARTGLLRELSDLQDEMTGLRQRVADRLNETLRPAIRISINQAGDRAGYRELLTRAFKGSGRTYRTLVDRIVPNLMPHTFARMIAENAEQEMVDRLGIDAERARWMIQLFRHTPAIFEIETVEIPDVPRVELKDGDDYKDSTTLSTGQKCTAILPILLLESEKPLLIDQPEDNLDNAFIYDTVVSKLRGVKQRRQLIFVTHNPNIPVLGNAGQVIVMDSTGRKALKQDAGDVDRVRGAIERILEGGEQAFRERMQRYGH